ncbi:hypothetical protein [Pseudomonas turukhanskensis]|uniref:Lipoprotein n=1 Tax=Pseudomonas turukhanskensis TaxID=1806536 RepID=A0A9W6K4S7_9PSED|nr:hypothetical protein [Pseudomonas turukhanskensis]GLK88787.1 hypothetical protein GCM10017655_18490 [Pseudomonas turukhanskensis]
MQLFRLMVLGAGLLACSGAMAATPGSPGTPTPNPYQTIQPRNVPMPAPAARPTAPGAYDSRSLPPANTVNQRDNGLQMQQAPSTPKVKPAEPVRPRVEE